MKISEKQIQEYKEMHLKEYGKEISDDEAREAIHNLVGLFDILIKVDRKEQSRKIKLKDEYLRPCHAIQKFATLYDDGEITPCEVLEKMRLGNLKDYEYDFYKLKNDRRLNDVYKKEVIEKKCNCDWMCAISHNLLYDPKTIPRVLFTLAAPGKLAYGGGDHTLK